MLCCTITFIEIVGLLYYELWWNCEDVWYFEVLLILLLLKAFCLWCLFRSSEVLLPVF